MIDLSKVHENQWKLEQKYHDKIKVGRWINCKYCYKRTRPELDWGEGLILCGECNAGLWPLQKEEDCEIYIHCTDFRPEPQFLSLVALRRRLDRGQTEGDLQKHYDFFTGGMNSQQKANFEKVARFEK